MFCGKGFAVVRHCQRRIKIVQGQNDFGCLSWLSKPQIQLTGPHSPPLTRQTGADLTRALCDKVEWLSAQKLLRKKALKVLNPKTIKACLSKTSLSFIPHFPLIPSSVVSTPPESVRGSAGLRFPNLSPHPSQSCPGPLVSWKSFVPPASYNTCTHTWTQMDWVSLFQQHSTFIEQW